MQRIDVGGHELAVEVSGRDGAPWIVLSNSLGTTTRMWESQLGLLEPHRQVLRYDTRGHGASDTPPGPYGFPDLVGDVVALLDRVGIDRADFMGLSIGGMTGLGLAIAHGDRINRLICCDARADAPEPFRAMWDERGEAVDRGGLAAVWPATVERWFTAPTRDGRPDLIAAFESDFVATPPEGYKGCGAALKSLDYLKDLGSIAVPTLYVGGVDDGGASPAVMAAMADATPEGRYVEIAHAAHIANCENPTDFNAAIAEFLGIA